MIGLTHRQTARAARKVPFNPGIPLNEVLAAGLQRTVGKQLRRAMIPALNREFIRHQLRVLGGVL